MSGYCAQERSGGAVRRGVKRYRWLYRDPQNERASELAASLHVNAVIARVLANRGIAASQHGLEQFMKPALSTLYDPFLMTDMDKAASRLAEAQGSGEQVTVFGDYDTDGTTSTALLLRTFRLVGIRANFYIPHRLNEGYGLSIAAIEELARRGTSLLVTVDNGITAVEQIRRACELGMDVIVTDHHQPGDILPDAVAVVNPSRRDCSYPNKSLAGVGVAFKLAHALLKKLNFPAQEATAFLRSILDLVAIGTVGDFVPLIGENRTLATHGLEQMRRTTNAGVAELKRLLQMGSEPISTHKIGFQISPRLNAAGRTDHASICVELLTTEDRSIAANIADRLDAMNVERRTVESKIFEHCLRVVDDQIDLDRDRVLVVNGDGWHVGVIGIVASKIMDLYHRPVIVISEHRGKGKGSARSISGFNIHAALTACSRHLTRFGGHPAAAGLQLEVSNIDSFRAAINDYAADAIAEENLQPSLMIDTEVDARELDDSLMRDMILMEPHGQHNPAPLLSVKGLKLSEPPRVVGTGHLKLQWKAQGYSLSGIGFNMAEKAKELQSSKGVHCDVAFVPSINNYWAQPRVELEIKDMKVTPGQV